MVTSPKKKLQFFSRVSLGPSSFETQQASQCLLLHYLLHLILSGTHALTYVAGSRVFHRFVEHLANGGFALNGFPLPGCKSITQVVEYLAMPRPDVNWNGCLVAYPPRANPEIIVAVSPVPLAPKFVLLSLRSMTSRPAAPMAPHVHKPPPPPPDSAPPPPLLPRSRKGYVVLPEDMNIPSSFLQKVAPSSHAPPLPPKPTFQPQPPVRCLFCCYFLISSFHQSHALCPTATLLWLLFVLTSSLTCRVRQLLPSQRHRSL
jgi:hypothetical protein